MESVDCVKTPDGPIHTHPHPHTLTGTVFDLQWWRWWWLLDLIRARGCEQ